MSEQLDSIVNEPAAYRYGDKLPADSAMLEELLRSTEIQQLFESYYNLITIPVAIIDLNANVLLSSRWQRICTQFHRVNPITCSRCIECDTKLATQLMAGKTYNIYPCKNGLTDSASPIIIEGKYIANLFIGQFLTAAPDESRFCKQAEEFGFDVADYLTALHEVPIVDADKIPVILDLSARMTRMITSLAIDRKRAVESQVRQAVILNTVPQSVFWKDLNGKYLGCNAPFAKAAGLDSPDDIVGKTDFDLPWPREDVEAYRADDLAVISANQPRLHIEEQLQLADGLRIVIDTSKIPLIDAGNKPYGLVGVYEDITERKHAEAALRESEELYRSLIMTMSEGVTLQDENSAIIAFNKSAERILGLSADQLMGKTSFDPDWYSIHEDGSLFPGETHPVVKTLKTGEPQSDVIMGIHKPDGTLTWISINVQPIFKEGKATPVRVVATMHDITERIRAEGELYRLNRELHAISECNQVLVRAEDEKTLITSICSIVCTKAGYRLAWVGYADQDEAKTVRPVAWAGVEEGYLTNASISWADTELGQGPTGTAIRRGEPVYTQDFSTDSRMAPWREKALTCGFLSSIALPLKDKNGTAFGAFTVYSPELNAFTPDEIRILEELTDDMAFGITVLRDRAAQKLAQAALVESENRYRLLFDSSPDGIVIIGPDGLIQQANIVQARMYGYDSPDELKGVYAPQLVAESSRDYSGQIMRRRLNGEVIPPVEYELLRKDGTTFLGEISASILRNPDQTVSGYICVTHDMTERKQAEEQRAKLESQLHQAQKMESIGSLAGGVAHDFNNKLSVILGCAYMASTMSDLPKIQNFLEEIKKAGEQSADLTRQLLAFARKQTIEPRVVNLNETVSGMLKMLSRLIGENIALTWNPATDLWLIKFDPSQIDQILANLCVNARDAITESGKIVIETGNCTVDEAYCRQHPDTLPGEYVKLIVSDNGCGMDSTTKTRIFEPFFTTKELGKGTGLGMATVFGIVKQNNGYIKVYSEPGEGTTITVLMPRYEAMTVPMSRQGMAESAPRGVETILLVEDEVAILNIVTTILTEQGYNVLPAGNPVEAIRKAKECSGMIDLLITDVIMPGMNGMELTRNLQELHPQLKCLFMSGYTSDAIASHGVLDKGVKFIQKPFSLPELAKKVRRVLDDTPESE